MLPDFDKLTPVDEYKVKDIAASAKSGRTDNYGFRFRAYYDIEEDGEYQFYTSSDDGTKLFIDSKMVVSNDGTHGANLVSGKIQLEKGKHEVEIQFFEGEGGEYLEVGTLKTDGEKIPLQPSKLYLRK